MAKRLICCVCGESAYGKQWWNRDTGYGICERCANDWEDREGEVSLALACGKRGVHFGVKDPSEGGAA